MYIWRQVCAIKFKPFRLMVSSFDVLEQQLTKSQWLDGGSQPSANDLKVYDSLKKLGMPKATSHARAFAWYSLVSRFSEDARNRWGGQPIALKTEEPIPAAQAITKKKVEKVEETKE